MPNYPNKPISKKGGQTSLVVKSAEGAVIRVNSLGGQSSGGQTARGADIRFPRRTQLWLGIWDGSNLSLSSGNLLAYNWKDTKK